MATSNTTAAVLAPVKGETLEARKARLDAAFHAGDKATRRVLMAHNGLRKAREDKGYGRAAMAKALKITAAEWWVAEFVLVPGTPEHKAILGRVNALPSIKKTATSSKEASRAQVKADTAAITAKTSQRKSKATAKTPDSVPPNSTDLI